MLLLKIIRILFWYQSTQLNVVCVTHISDKYLNIFSCDQAALWMVQSVRPSARHTFLTMLPSSYHHAIFRSYYQWQKWGPCKRSRSEVKAQGHRGQHPTWPFPDRNSSLNDDEMMHRAWCCLEEMPYCFSRSSVKFQGHTAKKTRRFWPKLGVSGLWPQFEFTNGYEMMHKAWSSIEDVPYCFSRSSVKFQGHTA